jgi:transcriptional regulator with XRE-family HTH domain
MRAATGTLSAIWADLSRDPDFKFKLKAQDIAVTLARAVAERGLSQADLAKALDWKPSRVSRVLHGDSNLTLRTIMEIAEACDLDFDLILRRAGEPRAAQPWEQDEVLKEHRQLEADARHRLNQAGEMLRTAEAINRRAWRTPYAALIDRASQEMKSRAYEAA